MPKTRNTPWKKWRRKTGIGIAFIVDAGWKRVYTPSQPETWPKSKWGVNVFEMRNISQSYPWRPYFSHVSREEHWHQSSWQTKQPWSWALLEQNYDPRTFSNQFRKASYRLPLLKDDPQWMNIWANAQAKMYQETEKRKDLDALTMPASPQSYREEEHNPSYRRLHQMLHSWMST